MEATDLSRKEPELELYTIPAQSSWFLWDDIHEIERRTFEEFFSESSITRTPKVYKEYRDFIINKYREDPSRRLTFTSVRKFLVGDVNLLQKVFLFLERWGLINFGAPNKSGDVFVENEGKHNAKIEEGCPAGIRVTATPNSMRPIATPPLVEDMVEGRVETGIKLPPLTSYSDVFSDMKKPHDLMVCGRCGERCDSPHYQHKKNSVSICEKCFKNGNYGEGNTVDDFESVDILGKKDPAGAVWTEEEILLLLESVLKYGDDWELIAQSVSTKSRLDCISKLIELPFGEFLMGSASGRLDSFIPTETTDYDNKGQHSPSQPEELTKTEGQELEETEKGVENEDRIDEEPTSKRQRVALLSDGGSSLLKQDSSLPLSVAKRSLLPPMEYTFRDNSLSNGQQVAAMASKINPSVTTAAARAAMATLCDEASCPKEFFESSDYINSTVDSLLIPERTEEDKDTDMKEQQEDKDETQESSSLDDLPIALRIRASAATALGAAAAHAKLLADQEEREMEHIAAIVIDKQLKKLESKLKFLDHLELIMDAEEKEIYSIKETIIEERISVLQHAFRGGITKRWDHMYVK